MRIGQVSVLLAVVGLAGVASADTVLDSTPSWNGSSSINSYGPPNTETYGESIIAPANGDNVLQSFTFYINVLTPTVPIQAEVYAWNGSHAVGPNLYQGPVLPLANTNGSFEAVTFDTGGLLLTPGQQYAIFSTSSNGPQDFGRTEWGFMSNTFPVPSSDFIFQNNGTDTSLWTSQNWANFLPGELAFQADFNDEAAGAPLPSTAGAGAVLLGVVGVLTRWSRRRPQVA
jgi:hypothetical protein